MLIKYYLKKWPFLAGYFIAIVLAPIAASACGVASGEMMDFATTGDYSSFLIKLAIYICYFFLHGGLLFIIQAFRARLTNFARRDLRQDMFRNIMNVDNAFFSKPDSGLHIAAFTNDITILETKYFEASLEAVESFFSIATGVTVLLTLNRKLAAIIIVGEIFSILICYFVRTYSINKNRIYIEKLASFTQKIKDYFSSFQMIQNYSVEAQIKKRFIKLNGETEKSKDEADMALAFVDTLARVCNSMIKFMLMGYGLALMMNGEITMGLIYTAYQFTNQIVGPMHSIISKINAVESVKSIVKRIKGISEASTHEEKSEEIKLSEKATVTLDNVSVEIDGKIILNGISHSFLPGKKYLIIGKNGAGKSTLLQLFKRSRDDFTGNISINGHDIRSFSYGALSNVVSYINESVSLICDTVKQNILLYRDIPDERLEQVVKTVGLKVSLDRVIRDGERNISSGETRRIEIARSLINRSDVIIYDEAISTLDIPTAFEIEKMLLSLENQTVLFVSHNFSSQLMNQYDEIILLDKGKISEYGTHDELMKTSEYYRRIMDIKNG